MERNCFDIMHSVGVFGGHLHGWVNSTETGYLYRYQYFLGG